ncbi:ferrochelatase [Paraburkholderia flagellata]|uniref:ferrochelatase n=1 Tax=Paraburkholderia flagellata TaxID=2883241 RepID=UPI001F2227B9|nr:ferrochelatase [Paraburkholderia flagellata]
MLVDATSLHIDQRDAEGKTGILLINLGTPDSPTPRHVGRYLREFLSDPRVVEIPQWIWQPVLRGAVVPLRSRASARKYESVWLPEGSPLRVFTERQVAALTEWLLLRDLDVAVGFAMRYGSPSIEDGIHKFVAMGVSRILVLPMYPQYAAATTATALDKVAVTLAAMKNPPEVRLVKEFHLEPGYIEAMARKIKLHWERAGRPNFEGGDQLILSFHGLPVSVVEKGDPYYAQCQATGKRLATILGLTPLDYRITFQSEFGRQAWISPHTADVLDQLGDMNVHRVDVFCPGFTADCVETIEEIGMEGRDLFLNAGGKVFHRIECLNDSESFISAVGMMAMENLRGWLPVNTQAYSDGVCAD